MALLFRSRGRDRVNQQVLAEFGTFCVFYACKFWPYLLKYWGELQKLGIVLFRIH